MSDVTRLTRRQVREVDRRAIELYGVPGIVLMENAARGAVEVARWIAGAKPAGKMVDVVCGGGNNGGDGLAIARHLHNGGYAVRVLLAIDPAKYAGDALTNWRIIQHMKLTVIPATQAVQSLQSHEPDLIVDALFGTGLSRPPRDDAINIINAMNANRAPILAVDLPSGLDCDTGIPLGSACVRAHTTVTFVAEKAGFANPESHIYARQVVVADIGCPKELIDEVLSTVPDVRQLASSGQKEREDPNVHRSVTISLPASFVTSMPVLAQLLIDRLNKLQRRGGELNDLEQEELKTLTEMSTFAQLFAALLKSAV